MELAYDTYLSVQHEHRKKETERAKMVEHQEESAVEPLLSGNCPWCGGYVSIWEDAINDVWMKKEGRTKGLDYCMWCHEPFLWDAHRLTDEQMMNWKPSMESHKYIRERR